MLWQLLINGTPHSTLEKSTRPLAREFCHVECDLQYEVRPVSHPWIDDTDSGAKFSPCRLWRYSLWRRWKSGCPVSRMAAFIGLNPSTADETEDDPTIRRCIGFSKTWGFDGFIMLNAYAWRDTDPAGMKSAEDPVGERNDDAIVRVASECGILVCAWGTHGDHRSRDTAIKCMLRGAGVEAFHLGLTKHGHPKHPLYLRADTKPVIWEL